MSKMHVLVRPDDTAGADAWLQTAMTAAYGEVTPHRRVLVLVNPVGGKGKARSVTKAEVVPLLEAAGCVLDVRGALWLTDELDWADGRNGICQSCGEDCSRS